MHENTLPATWDPGRAGTPRRPAVRQSGGGKKPCRQKGTGRAQQGSLRAPQYAGRRRGLVAASRELRQHPP